MILIISQERDYSTSEVIQWLNYYKAPFVRVNAEDICCLDRVNISNDKSCDFVFLIIGKGEIRFDSITSVWYRRGEINFHSPSLSFIENSDLRVNINRHLNNENAILQDYFYFLIDNISHVGSYRTRGMNKLIVLQEAKMLGIQIPETSIVCEKSKISYGNALITKSISEAFSPILKQGSYMTYTEIVEQQAVSECFFPSLFQGLVEKEADIRIFYLQNSFYGMAIRSQDHPQTKTDFRKYLNVKPSRHFPFKIPTELQSKLLSLMKRVNLETGSIDMIFTKDGQFIFLEVNPIGQFGMTSKPCNYFLEREVAVSLINNSNNF